MAETGPAPAQAGPIREESGQSRGDMAAPERARSAPQAPPRPKDSRPAYRGEGGFLLLDKPPGISSFQALRPVKRAFPKAKVGHAGTLDPAASGLLIAGVASGTRLLEYLEGLPKTYAFTAHFGFVSDTYDREGDVKPHPGGDAAPALTAERIAAALAPFRGRIRQVPPAYSAIKVDGERAYALARAGEAVVLQPREVEVASLELRAFRGPAAALGTEAAALSDSPGAERGAASPARAPGSPAADPEAAPRADFVMTCSKGTYVRSLVHDLGLALGCGAVTGSLRRLAIGPFRVEAASPPDGLGANPSLLPLESAVSALPAVIVPPDREARFLNGQTVTVEIPPEGESRGPASPSETGGISAEGESPVPDGRAVTGKLPGRSEPGEALPADGIEVRAHAAGGRLLAIATLSPGGRCSPRKVLARAEAPAPENGTVS